MKNLFTLAFTTLLASAKRTEADWFYPHQFRPHVIAHRGSLGHFPEHTIAGLTDAWLTGADFLELDLSVTADGVVIVHHDVVLKPSTDAKKMDDVWGDRKKDVYIPESGYEFFDDYIAAEFTLEELRMVKRRETTNWRFYMLDGYFDIPTLSDVILHIFYLRANYNTSRPINPAIPFDNEGAYVGCRQNKVNHKRGLYIEIKEYNFYLENYGVDMVQELYDILKKNNLDTIAKCNENYPIVIQSYSDIALKRFSELSDLPVVQLMRVRDEHIYDFNHIATYANAVAPDSDFVMYWPDNLLNPKEPVDITTRSAFVEHMHSLDLDVHPYTLQIDNLRYTKTGHEEIALFMNKGVDAAISDWPFDTFAVWERMSNLENHEISRAFLNKPKTNISEAEKDGFLHV